MYLDGIVEFSSFLVLSLKNRPSFLLIAKSTKSRRRFMLSLYPLFFHSLLFLSCLSFSHPSFCPFPFFFPFKEEPIVMFRVR